VKRLFAINALFVVMALSATGQDKAPRAPKTYLDRVYVEGETLLYNLSWLKVPGGTATMTARPATDKSGTIRLRSVAQSNRFFSRIYPVRDELESVVDGDDFTMVRFQKILNERNDREREVTVLDYERGVALRKGKEITITRPIFDPLSSIYNIRSLDLVAGRKHFLTVLADDKVYRMEAVVIRKETIRTEAGEFRTILVEPKMRKDNALSDEKDGRLLIWYSDDERRIPVRIVTQIPAGSVTATLRSFRIGSVRE